jgi:hypothetical protein
MKVSIEIRANVLNNLITQDREEIRGIRSTIYNATAVLSTASFAITSFLIGRDVHHASLMSSMTDGLIVLFLWAFFLRPKRDLDCCRRCLVAMQNLMKSLGTANEQDDFNPFPKASPQTDVTDSELWLFPILGTAAIAIKSLVVWRLFS